MENLFLYLPLFACIADIFFVNMQTQQIFIKQVLKSSSEVSSMLQDGSGAFDYLKITLN